MRMTSNRWVGSSVAALVAWCLAGLAGGSALAQGMPGGGAGYNAIVARLFADIPAFSAKVETALTNTADKSRLLIPMRMMKRDRVMRIEVDFTKMNGSGVAMQGLAGMQNIGMARMTSLVIPGEHFMRVLFPDLKFHSKVELSDSDLPNAEFKVQKKSLGKDTINGQACARQLVTIVSKDGQKNEATTWEATALNNFPVRISFKPQDSTMVMSFTEVALGAPPEDQFKVPADYKEFDSVSSLMSEAMTRAYKPAGK